ncbi:hypothetical protein CRG98_047660, partial [Punica granatum]
DSPKYATVSRAHGWVGGRGNIERELRPPWKPDEGNRQTDKVKGSSAMDSMIQFSGWAKFAETRDRQGIFCFLPPESTRRVSSMEIVGHVVESQTRPHAFNGKSVTLTKILLDRGETRATMTASNGLLARPERNQKSIIKPIMISTRTRLVRCELQIRVPSLVVVLCRSLVRAAGHSAPLLFSNLSSLDLSYLCNGVGLPTYPTPLLDGHFFFCGLPSSPSDGILVLHDKGSYSRLIRSYQPLTKDRPFVAEPFFVGFYKFQLPDDVHWFEPIEEARYFDLIV